MRIPHRFALYGKDEEVTNMSKIRMPKDVAECEMFRIIDGEILELLKRIEWYNEMMLEQFWSLNKV